MAIPLLDVNNLFKRIGSLFALEKVTFTLEPGEVLGVVGRRGAGKSTLFHILAGLDAPTAGEIYFDGHPIRFSSPYDAKRFGIELVHQNPLLAERLDVFQNIFLGRETSWRELIGPDGWKRMGEHARTLLTQLEMPPDLLHERTDRLSDEQRQVVAIARALCLPARLLLLDDALSALGFQRQEIMLRLIHDLADRGVAIMIISDDLKHLFAVTERILVLYEGRLVADRRTAESTPREIVELVVGSAHSEEVTPVIWALESYHTAQQQAEELRRVQDSLQQSLEVQGSLNRQLIQRLQDQVNALDELNVALQATQRRLMTEREQERKHLARELHDGVIQDLLSFNYRLEEMEEDENAAARRTELQEIRSGVRQVVSNLRQMCSDLRPPSIDNHGLTSAIRSFAQEWAEQNGVRLTLEVDSDLGRLPEAIELSIFRILQEGLNNIRKHATAKRVCVTLQRTATASLLVRLSDDGRGMSKMPDLAALSAQNHFGLLGISERVALLGGTMQVQSTPGNGLILQVEIPSPSPSI